MADSGNNTGGAASQGAAASGGQAQSSPSINVLGQYIKDLSFENPKAPESFNVQKEKSPPLNVSVNVTARQSGETNVEVELRLDAKAGDDTVVLFNIELVYAGLFQVRNVPQEQLHPFILIECPRLLFPFARQVIAETVASGGFPPLMLDPIDFAALYRQRMQQQAAQADPSQQQSPGQPN
jgi:preprotein translocase subunit SecB